MSDIQKQRLFLILNSWVGLFIFVRQGFLEFMALFMVEDDSSSISAALYFLRFALFLAGLMIAMSLIGLTKAHIRNKIIEIQAVVVSVGGFILLGLASSSSFTFSNSITFWNSFPLGTWMPPGLLTLLSFYWAYQLREVLLLPRFEHSKLAMRLPWIIASLAFIIDFANLSKIIIPIYSMMAFPLH